MSEKREFLSNRVLIIIGITSLVILVVGVILDFAGSNIPGVAYMNIGFGAEVKNYYSVKINNLPAIVKRFKK